MRRNIEIEKIVTLSTYQDKSGNCSQPWNIYSAGVCRATWYREQEWKVLVNIVLQLSLVYFFYFLFIFWISNEVGSMGKYKQYMKLFATKFMSRWAAGPGAEKFQPPRRRLQDWGSSMNSDKLILFLGIIIACIFSQKAGVKLIQE